MNQIIILVAIFLLFVNEANAEESLLRCDGWSNFDPVQSDRYKPVSSDLIITKTNGMITKVVKNKELTFTLEKINVHTDSEGNKVYRQLIVSDDSIALRTENSGNVKEPSSYFIIKNTGEYFWKLSIYKEYGKCIVPDKVF